MIDRPIFNPVFHVEVVESEGVYLLSERGHFVLKGVVHCRLAPLIDGTHTVDQIVDLLAGEISPAQVYYALNQMKQKGYIVAGTTAADEQAAFWRSFNLDPEEASRRLQTRRVALTARGSAATAGLAAALEALHVALVDPDEGQADLTVVVTDDYLQEGLEQINADALRSGHPWMLIKPSGMVLWIGPIFVPGKTGCWACLAQRLAPNREVESYLQQRKGIRKPFPVSRAELPSTNQAALQLAATEIALWLARGESADLEGQILTLEFPSLSSYRHPLIKRPQCPKCGDPAYLAAREPEPVRLQSRKKQFVADGGHRIATPEHTIAKYEKHVSPITGAVTLLARTPTDEEQFLHVYMAGHNFASQTQTLHFLKQGLRSKSAGKGMSDAQARASALCEAIERYSGLFQGDELRVRASYRQLGDAAIHPNACQNYSEEQYRRRNAWNARGSTFQVVSDPMDEDVPIEWTPIWSLTHETFKYVPTAYCYYRYPILPSEFFAWADSNGNAAGNTLEEAILQGFFELVERDAVAIWWYNRLQRPSVDLASFKEPYFTELQERYRRLNRDLWVLDITSDLEIPTFAAVSRRVDKPAEDILFSFGSHFDPRIGILRSLTEMNQFLPAVMHVRADGSGAYQYDDADSRHWWQTARLEQHPYLAPAPGLPARHASDYPRAWSDDVRDDVLRCKAIVEAKGMEMLVLDQTRLDVGLPVAKVIVPGMRHFWARFAPGRLYDVPVQMGWLAERLREDQLNPIPIFI
ncbi:MAG TPA: TOMM precursor leader peptide-binding protein [Kouleothrix sp.]|uniref:TOMM precursor leader peptide-binding protein n=1 Tax=Kouleothrix sp. TaxID=2779161 RepID=UPI002BA866A9|nr:TOMM precursor leader peptide-binding protein [Kouleothrix sp.]